MLLRLGSASQTVPGKLLFKACPVELRMHFDTVRIFYSAAIMRNPTVLQLLVKHVTKIKLTLNLSIEPRLVGALPLAVRISWKYAVEDYSCQEAPQKPDGIVLSHSDSSTSTDRGHCRRNR